MNEASGELDKAGRLARRACWILGAALLLFGAVGGADYLRYLDWGWAFALNDIFRLGSNLASPVGLPLFQWSHGPGLFYALPAFIHRLLQNFSPLAADIFGNCLISGWLAVLILWWSLTKLIRERLGSLAKDSYFWLSIAFLATHLGYYSISHGSESLALGCLALLGFWTIPSRTWQTHDVITAAMLAACLIITRSQMGLYAILGMVLALYHYKHSEVFTNSRKSWAIPILTSVFVLAMATSQILLVNYWMTGSPFGSTHAFGYGPFKSFDFANPEISAVLFHPWHGLFVYHPFYLIGIFALIRRMLLASTKAERCFLMALSAAIALHMYLQAAWYCWWLGLWSFGMRGLSVLGLILLLVVIDDYRRPATSIWIKFLYTRGGVICSLWSYLLMVQGDSNLMTYRQLITAQWRTLCSPSTASSLFISVGTGILLFLLDRKRHRQTSFELICTCGMFFLALQWLFVYSLPFSIPLLSVSGTFIIALLCPLQFMALPVGEKIVQPSLSVYTRIRLTVFTCFALISIIFFSFSLSTYGYIRGDKPAPRKFSQRSKVYYPEVRECYAEYLRVPGFDEKKERLLRYLMDGQ